MATVTAVTDLVCHGLTYWEFRPLVQGNGAIGWKLLQSMAKMLRDAAGPTAPLRVGTSEERRSRRQVGLPGGVDRARARHDPEAGLRLTRAGAGGAAPPRTRRRSSLRELQGRHDATTLSQVWGPPRERGTTWSMFSAGRLQYWQRCPSRAKTARRESGTRLRYGHPHEVVQPDHRRDRELGPLGVQDRAVARHDLGLLLQHEDDGSPHGHDAERLEAGVEQQGSSQASAPPTSPGNPVTRKPGLRPPGRGSSASLPRPVPAPDEVVDQVVGVGPPVGAVLGLEAGTAGSRDRAAAGTAPVATTAAGPAAPPGAARSATARGGRARPAWRVHQNYGPGRPSTGGDRIARASCVRTVPVAATPCAEHDPA